MMIIGKAKIDKRGRVQLPRTFLEANDLVRGEDCVIYCPVMNSDEAIKLVFIKKPATAISPEELTYGEE